MKINSHQFKYLGKLYKELFKLQGTKDFEAYYALFPITSPEPEAHYQIIKDKTNRQLIVAMCVDGKSGVQGLAEKLSLDQPDIRKRIAFFKANGLRKDVADKYI